NEVAQSASCWKPPVSVGMVSVARIPPIVSITAATWTCLCVSTPITTCPDLGCSLVCTVFLPAGSVGHAVARRPDRTVTGTLWRVGWRLLSGHVGRAAALAACPAGWSTDQRQDTRGVSRKQESDHLGRGYPILAGSGARRLTVQGRAHTPHRLHHAEAVT